jgi:hypothetical protein
VEQSTALRLQTIATLYGLRVELPDRIGPAAKANTRERIARASYVVAFPLQGLSSVVKEELEYAASIGKTILVVYEKRIGSRVKFKEYPRARYWPIDFDGEPTDKVLSEIAQFIKSDQVQPPKSSLGEKHNADTGSNALLAFLGIGLGILALAAILDDDSE